MNLELITSAALARRLGMSPRTVEGWRHRGGGPPYVKLGASVRYRIEDVDLWLAERGRFSTTGGAA